jgi:hypothetical protein
MKISFYQKFFEKYFNTRFLKNPSSGKEVVPCGQTYGQKDRHTEREKDRQA